jgi:oligogalacturonide lyase
MSVLTGRVSALTLITLIGAPAADAAGVGRRFPAEKRVIKDAVTSLNMTFLTTDTANDSKPYQTDPTWTADGKWILLRSNRGDSGPQAFLLNEKTGDIVQATEGETSTANLTLSRKVNRMYLLRGGPRRGPGGPGTPAPPPTPRQLIEVNLDPLIADAMAGTPKPAATYERVVATLPSDMRAGALALDADESRVYLGVSLGPPPPPPVPRAAPTQVPGGALPPRRVIDDQNMDPTQDREVSRKRFEAAGKGESGIRSVDVRTGEITTVIDVPFRMGHMQTNPWVPGEIMYCHETTGDAPLRAWVVRADGTGNRPVYAESPDEWMTHETFATKDEVMFNLMGHLPYQREKPSGVAVVNLRTKHMTIVGQIEEDMGGGRTGGLWHCNGSGDGKWAVADSFKGNVYLIDRRNGERILLTTGHKMLPDHTHPIFSPDGKRVLIQSGQLTEGKSLDLVVIDVPAALLSR